MHTGTHILTRQSFLISFIRGSIVRGPLAQFSPTTAAPSSSNRLQASGIGTLSVVMSGQYAANVITAGKPLIMTKTEESVQCYIISQFACSYLKNNSMKRYSDNTV